MNADIKSRFVVFGNRSRYVNNFVKKSGVEKLHQPGFLAIFYPMATKLSQRALCWTRVDEKRFLVSEKKKKNK